MLYQLVRCPFCGLPLCFDTMRHELVSGAPGGELCPHVVHLSGEIFRDCNDRLQSSRIGGLYCNQVNVQLYGPMPGPGSAMACFERRLSWLFKYYRWPYKNPSTTPVRTESCKIFILPQSEPEALSLDRDYATCPDKPYPTYILAADVVLALDKEELARAVLQNPPEEDEEPPCPHPVQEDEDIPL
jgi:hypothetical protein